jgi:hypothetical protein
MIVLQKYRYKIHEARILKQLRFNVNQSLIDLFKFIF